MRGHHQRPARRGAAVDLPPDPLSPDQDPCAAASPSCMCAVAQAVRGPDAREHARYGEGVQREGYAVESAVPVHSKDTGGGASLAEGAALYLGRGVLRMA